MNLLSLKSLLGIRNRFWRKRYDVLKPKLYEIYKKSLIVNYFPFYVAFRKVNLIKKFNPDISRKEIEEYYLKNWIIFCNRYKNRNQLLEEKQKIKPIFLNDRLTFIVLDYDGLSNEQKRQEFLDVHKEFLNVLLYESYLHKEEFQKRFYQIISNQKKSFTNQDVFSSLLSSKIGVFLSRFVPGFPLMLELYRIKEQYQPKNWKEILKIFLTQNLSFLFRISFERLLKNYSLLTKNLVFLGGEVLNHIIIRYETYKKCEEVLEKNYQKLLNLQKEIKSKEIT
ncbi:MAG: hypothetical protein NZ853_05280 [Leptospiraceae bacterium]|nr:hypothetical protein [Leptospiraceae bacterium]MDW7976640.1 hypothetical protein [Leptospiraceae bacterium]